MTTEINPRPGQALKLEVIVVSVTYKHNEIRVRYQERFSSTRFTLRYKQQELIKGGED